MKVTQFVLSVISAFAFFGTPVTSSERWETPCKDVATPPSVTAQLVGKMRQGQQRLSATDTDGEVLKGALQQTKRLEQLIGSIIQQVRCISTS